MKKKAIILLIMLSFSGIYAQEKVITVKYYFVEGCPYCEVVKSIIDGIEKDYSDIEVVRMNVYKSSVYMNEFLSYGFWKVPAVVINGKAKFQGDEEVTDQNLRNTIEDYLNSYRKGNSFFGTGKKYYGKKDYKKAKVYLEEAKTLLKNGNFDTNSTEILLEKCNLCIESSDLIFKGDLFLENGDKEKAREIYSQIKCEDLKDTAEEKIKNIDNYEDSLKNFDKAVEYYNHKEYSQALDIFESIENILVDEKQKECEEYIEKCRKYIDAENMYNEGVNLIFDNSLSAYEKFIKAGDIYESLEKNQENYNKFAEAAINFYIGKTIYRNDSKSALKYFKEAKKDFEYLGFDKGVEKCDYYIEKSKKKHLIYWISFIILSISISFIVYLSFFRKKKKKKKESKKELKKLVDKYANGEISLEEFDKKKKKVIK